MALPTLDAVFASAADVPRRYMLAQWLVNILYSGSVADYLTLPERYLWAKIAVAAGAPKDEAFYINAPKQYAWKDIYDAVSGSSLGTIDWGEKQALGHIAAAYRGDTANPANLATYIDWPWRYQIASIVTNTAIDTDAQSFITTSGATDIEALDQFVKGVKDLGLWDSMVAWPLRSSQNAGTGTTAYSLGGLGTFNGTLVNGPTWDIDGVTFDGTNDLVTASVSFPASFTMFVVAKNLAAAKASRSMMGTSGGTANTNISISTLNVGNNYGLIWAPATGQQLVYTSSIATGDLGDFEAIGLGYTLGAREIVKNGATFDAGVTDPTTPLATETKSLHIGGNSQGNSFFNGEFSIGALISGKISQAEHTGLYTLYKSTLGTGLLLP